MAWKLERWLDEVFPGEHELFSQYSGLTDRELAIVAAGNLDLALAELINKRLVNIPKESCAFLGLDESGSAPAGSMGARIQLALLLGIIHPEDARILRIIKNIRNKFAHRISISFLDDSIQGLLSKLLNEWSERSRFLLRSQPEQAQCASEEGLKLLQGNLGKTSEVGEGLLLAVFSVYQAYFYRLSLRIERVSLVVGERA